MQVLYGANTIHISSKPLLTNLSAFIVPQRLTLVTSLEVVWLLDTYEHSGVAIPRQNGLDVILSIPNSAFLQLKNLNLALKVKLPSKMPVYLDDMIKTLDSFVAHRTSCL